jgi:carboxymethylenebutenolidase
MSSSSTIHTSSAGLEQGLFDLEAPGQAIQAYFARPAGAGSFPVILVVQEIFGLNEHTQDICRRFAHEGYLAIAADLTQRQGDAGSYTDIPALVREVVAKVPDEQVMADLDACAKWAMAHGGAAGQLGVTGFCWGGRIAWLYAAHNPDCKAAVAWYGRISTGHGPLHTHHPIHLANELHAPVLGLYGAKDTGIPVDDVHRLEALLAQGNEAARASRFHVYPESGHAFFADYRPSYHAEDARDGWTRALEWFGRHIAK